MINPHLLKISQTIQQHLRLMILIMQKALQNNPKQNLLIQQMIRHRMTVQKPQTLSHNLPAKKSQMSQKKRQQIQRIHHKMTQTAQMRVQMTNNRVILATEIPIILMNLKNKRAIMVAHLNQNLSVFFGIVQEVAVDYHQTHHKEIPNQSSL